MEKEPALRSPAVRTGASRAAAWPSNPDSPMASAGSSCVPAQFYNTDSPPFSSGGGAPECPPACERPGGGPSFCPLFLCGGPWAIPGDSRHFLGAGWPALGSVPVPGENKGRESRQASGGTKAPIPSAFEATGRGVDGPDWETGRTGEGLSLPCADPCGWRPIGGGVRL